MMDAFGQRAGTDEERHVRGVAALCAVTVVMMANRDSSWADLAGVVRIAVLGALDRGSDRAGGKAA
ncbi:hypothetical protein ACFOZ0_13210 [Streptomyces yaanensis]|uniref:TetR family transcriptional regulator n=1 Tax=Streptomyces yaanensis TaxID=1142239 RepID=A0ABV7SCH1_9ACTN|nr:hypothetical protein [Streptomyces sp. CGMCC 4.7035]WNC03350.1 hypothetical protein Q2K21_13085 [Streptomyces sp. CGMCC 4.7035]